MVDNAHFSIKLCHPRYWLLWFGIGLARLLVHLPMPVQMRLGGVIGRLSMKFLKRRVHIARRNLELCFPELNSDQREQLLKDNFVETGKAIFDTLNAWYWSDARVDRHLTIKGQEYIDQTQQDGHGVILFAVHCLPLEMGGRVLGRFKIGFGVYRPHNNALMEYFQVKGRLRAAKGLIPKRDLRQMVRSLRQKDLVWYTADQDFGRSSAVFVPFFAKKSAATITGATTLAKLGKAKVLPFFVERNKNDQGYTVEIMPPLDNFPGENEYQDAIRGNQIIENLIDRNKSQYMWLHRRFKTRPNTTDKPVY